MTALLAFVHLHQHGVEFQLQLLFSSSDFLRASSRKLLASAEQRKRSRRGAQTYILLYYTPSEVIEIEKAV